MSKKFGRPRGVSRPRCIGNKRFATPRGLVVINKLITKNKKLNSILSGIISIIPSIDLKPALKSLGDQKGRPGPNERRRA